MIQNQRANMEGIMQLTDEQKRLIAEKMERVERMQAERDQRNCEAIAAVAQEAQGHAEEHGHGYCHRCGSNCYGDCRA